MNLGRNEDAPSDYSKTIEIDPEYILAYNNGGTTINHGVHFYDIKFINNCLFH